MRWSERASEREREDSEKCARRILGKGKLKLRVRFSSPTLTQTEFCILHHTYTIHTHTESFVVPCSCFFYFCLLLLHRFFLMLESSCSYSFVSREYTKNCHTYIYCINFCLIQLTLNLSNLELVVIVIRKK